MSLLLLDTTFLIDAEHGDQVRFYHFDRDGNTLFLSDTNGIVADSYAYTPYGKLLHHQGSSEQPFTFRGAYGVRQEGTNGLYHLTACWYDATTTALLCRRMGLGPRPGVLSKSTGKGNIVTGEITLVLHSRRPDAPIRPDAYIPDPFFDNIRFCCFHRAQPAFDPIRFLASRRPTVFPVRSLVGDVTRDGSVGSGVDAGAVLFYECGGSIFAQHWVHGC